MKYARLQVDISELPDDRPPQTGDTFNIWFLRWSGGDGTKLNEKAKFRVNISKDSGITKADKYGISTICLFFSRGCCFNGKNCKYLHRLPTNEDYYPPTQDCFGRDKGADSNAGRLGQYNTTLYVSGISITSKTQAVLTKHFSEFGNIEKIKVVNSLNCAFITYVEESEAQFAKEAMSQQSLDDNEILNVKWANEDPNPETQRANKRKLEERTIETVKKLLKQQESLEEVEEPDEPEIEEPEEQEQEEQEQKQLKIENGSKSMFDQQLLKNLSRIRKVKPKKPSTLDLGYSSDSE